MFTSPHFLDMNVIQIGHDAGEAFKSYLDDSVYNAIHSVLFNDGQLAAHRLALFNPNGEITYIISQFDVAR